MVVPFPVTAKRAGCSRGSSSSCQTSSAPEMAIGTRRTHSTSAIQRWIAHQSVRKRERVEAETVTEETVIEFHQTPGGFAAYCKILDDVARLRGSPSTNRIVPAKSMYFCSFELL